MLAISLAVLVALALVGRRFGGSLLYPPATFAAVWALCLALYGSSGDLFFKIADDTLFFYVWCACAFGVGGSVMLVLRQIVTGPSLAPRPVSASRHQKIKWVLDFCLLILVIGLPFYIRYIMSLIENEGILGFFITIRAKMIQLGDESMGAVSFMDNLVVLANAVALVVYYEDDHSRSRRWRTWLALALAGLYNVLTAGRAGIVTLILSLFALHWLKEKKPNWKVLTALGTAFIVTFVALAILVRKGDVEKDATVVENLPAVFDGFLWYALGGIVAFDTVYHRPTEIEANQNVDRDLQVVAKKFDNQIEVPSIHSQYTTIGPTGNMNVYTAYFSYYPEFGFVGTTVILFLLGACLTWMYLLARSGSPQATILFSIMFAGIVLTGYAENLLLNINFLAKMFLFTFVLYRFRNDSQQHVDKIALSFAR